MDLGFSAFAASLVLVAIVIGISRWKRLGLERDVLVASVRAGVQLLLVGLVFTAIVSSDLAMVWAWFWTAFMVALSSFIIIRRAYEVPKLAYAAVAAMLLTTAVVLGVVFGLGVLDLEPVALIVTSGITMGNTMPAVVLGTNRTLEMLRSDYGQVEAMLALGSSGATATHHLETQVLSTALTPQIERTKVVGLIALPGAMTGLLLAGTEPIDAVLLQLVVMFLVLGSMATSVVFMTRFVAHQSLTGDLRIASWVRDAPNSMASAAS